ncbi:uncharacterized protein LOC127857192 [Dreissena polymorpha]|uniref:uncharacterized protein LOC127857192 n=1 Tax=Dreissena polymorpha TaxID=45954 RepID=UPI002263BDA0|nr:uncharacterized protein LOC127857192 [Dreissena polymorpha]
MPIDLSTARVKPRPPISREVTPPKSVIKLATRIGASLTESKQTRSESVVKQSNPPVSPQTTIGNLILIDEGEIVQSSKKADKPISPRSTNETSVKGTPENQGKPLRMFNNWIRKQSHSFTKLLKMEKKRSIIFA